MFMETFEQARLGLGASLRRRVLPHDARPPAASRPPIAFDEFFKIHNNHPHISAFVTSGGQCSFLAWRGASRRRPAARRGRDGE